VLVNNGVGEGHDSGWGLAFAVVRDIMVDPCMQTAGHMDKSVFGSAEFRLNTLGPFRTHMS
jgi:hypothetical protein